MKKTSPVLIFIFIFFQVAFAQNATPTPFKNSGQTTREKREQSLAKLLEGQRYIWGMKNQRQQAAAANGARLAKQALQKAVELDPTLDEAYTAMSEVAWLSWLSAPNDLDLDEAVTFANTAIKINRDNYGSHHRLAWIYTIKSGIRGDKLDKTIAEKAIAQWKEIARLDPRNAEAFAFLSAFYERTANDEEQIAALKKWLVAANPPVSVQNFYMSIMGRGENLSPESASVKLGRVLLDAGRASEAIEYLNRAILDNPDDADAVELFREALESADAKEFPASVEILRQAVYANPENIALISLLAEIEARGGKLENAAKILRDSISKLAAKDKITAANLQIALGDIYADAERFTDAVAAYQNALTTREITDSLVTDSERGFAAIVYEKIIGAYKNANQLTEAKNVIEKTRALFGKDDLFADKKLIDLYRESGKKQEALQTARAARTRFPNEYSLLRLEAWILTETGKTDEAVALVKTLINQKNSDTSSPQYNDFSNYIFISMLYSESKRGKEAIAAANQAHAVAKTDDQKQLAKLSLATAQQMSGDFKAAEETLRALLKQTPGNPIALNNLGYFLLERNEKFDEALELIKQAVKIDPTNPSYLDSLGWAFYKLGKYAEAEKYLKTASRLASSSATILEHLGDAYQKQNKTALAKSAWQKALNLAFDTEMTERIKAKLNK